MSSTKTETTQPVSPKKSGMLSQDTRVDSAHPINGQLPQIPSASDADSVTDSAVADSAEAVPIPAVDELPKNDLTSEQLHRQAEQLAVYLGDRQKELDHREAQLNAEIAQVETDIRNARMWISEREADQDERRRTLDDKEKEFLERLERLATADAALKRQIESKGGLNDGVDRLQVENQLLDRKTSALDEERLQAESQQQQAEDALRQRQEALEEAENRLAQAQTETQNLHEQLSAQRRELHEEMHRERQRLVVQQRQALADLEQKRQTLQRRGEHVDQCRAALLRLRTELQQMHRETLEIRLSTEELWIKLSGAATPAALTHSLGRIRNRLADQYRLANAELIERKTELETVRDQLAGQYEKLVEQKRQLESWMESKQGESQQQSSMLLAREQALLQQQTRFEEQSEQWQVERIGYEQEIRRLHLKLARQSEETASV